MDIDFTGKTALVTGAGKGIGRATAKLLAKCGASVIALTRTQSDLDSLKQEIPNLRTICVDLQNIYEVVKAVDSAGHIDLLVNNAAYIITKSCLEVTKDDVEKSMAVCVTAPLMISQVVVKKLLESGKRGAIVNISTAGTKLGVGFPPLPYVAAKSALESVATASAVELAPSKIRVNCVLPAATNTPALQNLVKMPNMEQFQATVLGRLPINRIAEPEEIAQTIVYLLSDKSSYITGQCVAADGGFSVA